MLVPAPHIALLSTFVEKWQPDMNSFYMLFGEMNITLHDVELILGVPTYGIAIGTEHTRKQLLSIVNSDFDVWYIGTSNDYF